jgi:hypothetical protein
VRWTFVYTCRCRIYVWGSISFPSHSLSHTPLPLFDRQTQQDKQTASLHTAFSFYLTCVLMRCAGKSNIDTIRAWFETALIAWVLSAVDATAKRGGRRERARRINKCSSSWERIRPAPGDMRARSVSGTVKTCTDYTKNDRTQNT